MPKFSKKIYDTLPAAFQHMAVSWVGWETSRKRYGGRFHEILEELQGRDCLSQAQIVEFREQRFRKYLQEVVLETSYYQKLFAEYGLSKNDIQHSGDLAKLPVLKKGDVQRNWQDFLNPEFADQPCKEVWTSGTTGTGMRVRQAWDSYREQWAVWWRYRMRFGLRINLWQGLLAGHIVVPPTRKSGTFWRVNRPGKAVLYSYYHLIKENILRYIEDIRRRELPWIHGYPSSINMLVQTMLEEGESLPSVKWVSTGGESLLPQQREAMEKAFGVKVRDHYGLGEGVANISHCPQGNYHVDEDFSAVEFVPYEHGDQLYRIVGTNFSNPAFPLLRFDTTDLARLSDKPCSCGLPGRIVAEILGRNEDYIITAGGTKFKNAGWFFYGILNLREAQLVQKEKDRFLVRLVPGKNFTDTDQNLILQRLEMIIGKDVQYEFQRVSEIERTKNGKFKVLISEVED